jgi:predicted TIM-barrel fold metal-dependent hydrolase
LLLILAGCAHGQREPASGKFPERIIDAHVHLDEVWRGGDVSEFTNNRVSAVVTHASMKNPAPKAERQFPFRVKVCAGVSDRAKPAQVEAALRDGRVGCLKIYLGYVKRWASDPVYRPFYRLAEKYKVPVVFHTGDTLDNMGHVKYTEPVTIDEIATAHPKVKFLIAHVGNPWFQSAAEVVYKNDNVYVDTSALMLGDLSGKDPEAVEELVVKPLRWVFLYVENPKKFLFGTDWPLCRIGPYVEAVKRAIPPEHWQAVFHDNAAEFFGL